ncbi:helix-turn-helix transcriptional regulator [Rhodococcoides fascians]|uniref:helix-turn-helix transcriptional regulator n=1 Tax=Rhodococcoides fascians TaxID=1828 RepID=UPI0018D696B6|nr:LuxR C-terminal-related transcriptional regulator [Rhodococcus fascians]
MLEPKVDVARQPTMTSSFVPRQIQLLVSSVVGHSEVGIITLDRDLRIVAGDLGACQVIGCQHRELRGLQFPRRVEPDERGRISAGLVEAFNHDSVPAIAGPVVLEAQLQHATLPSTPARLIAFRENRSVRDAMADRRVWLNVVIIKSSASTNHRHPRDLELSEIALRIVERIAGGNTTAEIASDLHLSKQGVEYHVSSMLRRLKVANRPALIAKAYELNILDRSVWPPRLLSVP